jgi:hypothetical protein
MGGIRLVKKTCSRCETVYNGIHNQQLCNECKAVGFDRICKCCNQKFITLYRYTNHCEACKENLVWKRGKFPSRGSAISAAKKDFFQTDYGKEVAAKVGAANSVNMKTYLQTEAGKESLKIRGEKISAIMKRKIADGTYTPKITNSFTHWNAIIDTGLEIKKFRSSWEACIWYSNQGWQYEKIRIKYIGDDLKEHVYIVDFFDPINNILYEIKPSGNIKDSLNKIRAAVDYCDVNKMKFVLISEKDLLNYIKPEIFTGNNKKQLEKCLK